MSTVEVAYLYEHAARELDVACAVAARLRTDHNLRAEILHWPTGFRRALTRIRPRLVLLPFCYTERSYDALLAYWREVPFFNLTWEQLFYAGNQKAKTPRGEFAREHVIHHAWSRYYADFLVKNGVAEKHIFLNGQPAYTLYDPPYRAFFSTRAQMAERFALDPARRWIFFPENYNWAFYSENMIRLFIEGGQSPTEIAAMQEYCERSLDQVIRWLAEVAGTGEFEVIIRPRPSTTLDQFRVAMNKIVPVSPAHLHVIQQDSVREWILASDLVFSSHSTSLIEAAVAGKPVFMMEPCEIPAALRADWQARLPHIQTRAQFLEICSGSHSAVDDRLAAWARETLMSRGDSIANLADFIAALLCGKVEPALPPAREIATPTLGWIPPARLWSVYRWLRQAFRYPATNGVEPGFVKDVVEPQVIEAKIQKWMRLLDRQDESCQQP